MDLAVKADVERLAEIRPGPMLPVKPVNETLETKRRTKQFVNARHSEPASSLDPASPCDASESRRTEPSSASHSSTLTTLSLVELSRTAYCTARTDNGPTRLHRRERGGGLCNHICVRLALHNSTYQLRDACVRVDICAGVRRMGLFRHRPTE